MMPLEEMKKLGESLTGIGVPAHVEPRPRKPWIFRFKDDGQTPNNPFFPLILYRSPVKLDGAFDPAAVFESLFVAHGWKGSWRNGIYGFLHFHSHTHEVLGVARGTARAEFGGHKGRVLELRAGDVVILPAGTGHRRLSRSRDLLVVGAYPRGHDYDQPRPSEVDHAGAVRDIRRVGVPASDPVYGPNGPLRRLWRN